MNGPYRTWQDAHESVKAARDRLGLTGEDLGARMFGETLAAADVELGDYDSFVLAWLAKYEPQTVAVVCGVIARAAAGKRDESTHNHADGSVTLSAGDVLVVLNSLDDAREWCTDNEDCGECRATEYGPCESHRERAERDASYRRLMGKLAGGSEVPEPAPQPTSRVLPDGSATLTNRDLRTVICALSDGAYIRSNHPDESDLALIARYRSLGRSLGDHR